MDGRGRERTQKFKEMRESNYMSLVHCFVGCSDRQTGGRGYMWYVPPTTPTCQSHGPISVMPLLGSKRRQAVPVKLVIMNATPHYSGLSVRLVIEA